MLLFSFVFYRRANFVVVANVVFCDDTNTYAFTDILFQTCQIVSNILTLIKINKL